MQKEWGDSLEVEMVAGPSPVHSSSPRAAGTAEAKIVTDGHVTSGTPDGRRERFERLVGPPDGVQKESGLNCNVRARARARHSLSGITVDRYLNPRTRVTCRTRFYAIS